jgi:glucose-6-phosphate dehydrogenase assembly protein OpcA
MGYYYNWLAQKWLPRSKPTATQKSQREFRHGLIADLLTEIEDGSDSVASMYAGLLARTLVTTDAALMDEYGERIANLGTWNTSSANRDRENSQRHVASTRPRDRNVLLGPIPE